MKILHINRGQEGGAAFCAIRIHNALIRQGIESKFLVAEGKNEESICVASPDKFKNENICIRIIKRVIRKTPWFYDKEKMESEFYKKNYSQKNPLYIHHPFSNYTSISRHPLVEWADIIHLHWVPEFVDYSTFFKEVNKPIIWTLHDKYPLVGIQHYCSEHYPVPDHLKLLDEKCAQIKRKGVLEAYELNVVAISETMKTLCEDSPVLKDFPCHLIHNGVDVNIFTHSNKEYSRRDLLELYASTIDSTKEKPIVFLFSSYWLNEENKGLQRVIAALEQVVCKNKMLIVVGNGTKDTINASFPIISLGLIKDQVELAKIYSASDYFIQASYEETFAQTPLEAMACGTPVVSTPVSGASDLIRPFNGVICNGYNPDSLKEGIEEAMSKVYDSSVIRNYIVENFNYDKIAKEYIELYRRVKKV